MFDRREFADHALGIRLGNAVTSIFPEASEEEAESLRTAAMHRVRLGAPKTPEDIKTVGDSIRRISARIGLDVPTVVQRYKRFVDELSDCVILYNLTKDLPPAR